MTAHHHRQAKVRIGESSITIEQASGSLSFANIIHAERDTDGRIISAMLDRHVHDEHTGYQSDDGSWSMAGCFATQMTLNRDLDFSERTATRDLIRGFVERVVEADDAAVKPGGVSRYRLCTTITDHILEQHGLVGFWGRESQVDALAGWIVQQLDDANVADLDALDGMARRIVGMCRVHLAK